MFVCLVALHLKRINILRFAGLKKNYVVVDHMKALPLIRVEKVLKLLMKNFWYWKEFKVSWQDLCDSSAKNYLVQFICCSRTAETIWMLRNVGWCRVPPPFVHWKHTVLYIEDLLYCSSCLISKIYTYPNILHLIFEIVRLYTSTLTIGVRPHTHPISILKAACRCPWFCVQRKLLRTYRLLSPKPELRRGKDSNFSLNFNELQLDIHLSRNLDAWMLL